MEEQLQMTATTTCPQRAIGRALLATALLVLLGACATTTPSLPAPVATAAPVMPAPVPASAAASATATTPTAVDLPAASIVALADAALEKEDRGPATREPVDPLQPDTPIKIDEPTVRTDLWQRVRGGFAMADLDTNLVRNWERHYATRPDYVQRMTERGGRYLFHIMQEVERRGLPAELALLPFIESAFNPEAMSSARASGMWQFMPATGRAFDLTQNVFRDDRRGVLESTRAALDYLTMLHKMFGDWQLALAAYNWGQGNVQRAVRANRARGLPATYLDLRMPIETRDYVPKLQAVKNIVAEPARFGIALPALENHPYFLAVPIARDIDIALVARLAALPLAEVRALNPQLNKPVILAAGTPQVLLPYDNAKGFVKAVAAHKGPLATWTAWVAPNTMKTAEAARQVGMDEEDLREVNKIPPRMLVKAGSTLVVPRAKHREADVSERIADNGSLLLASEGPPLKRVAFKAGSKGESVSAVAKRYRVPADQVAQWNKVGANARFAAGSTVVVYVPQRATRVAKAAPSKAGKAGKAGNKSTPVRVAAAKTPTRTR
jgi:membrane-bound lytic murein transglycosylase D